MIRVEIKLDDNIQQFVEQMINSDFYFIRHPIYKQIAFIVDSSFNIEDFIGYEITKTKVSKIWDISFASDSVSSGYLTEVNGFNSFQYPNRFNHPCDGEVIRSSSISLRLDGIDDLEQCVEIVLTDFNSDFFYELLLECQKNKMLDFLTTRM